MNPVLHEMIVLQPHLQPHQMKSWHKPFNREEVEAWKGHLKFTQFAFSFFMPLFIIQTMLMDFEQIPRYAKPPPSRGKIT